MNFVSIFDSFNCLEHLICPMFPFCVITESAIELIQTVVSTISKSHRISSLWIIADSHAKWMQSGKGRRFKVLRTSGFRQQFAKDSQILLRFSIIVTHGERNRHNEKDGTRSKLSSERVLFLEFSNINQFAMSSVMSSCHSACFEPQVFR